MVNGFNHISNPSEFNKIFNLNDKPVMIAHNGKTLVMNKGLDGYYSYDGQSIVKLDGSGISIIENGGGSTDPLDISLDIEIDIRLDGSSYNDQYEGNYTEIINEISSNIDRPVRILFEPTGNVLTTHFNIMASTGSPILNANLLTLAYLGTLSTFYITITNTQLNILELGQECEYTL